MLQVQESLLAAPMIGGFYHCWERANEVRKQVMNGAKCWQEFQSKQNWNIIKRIPFGEAMDMPGEHLWKNDI